MKIKLRTTLKKYSYENSIVLSYLLGKNTCQTCIKFNVYFLKLTSFVYVNERLILFQALRNRLC